MREILFRGKRIANGQWITGYVFKQYNTIERRDDYYIRAYDIDYLVLPETVGQFTGLTDKNGIEIFEGDIIEGRVYFTGGYRIKSLQFADDSDAKSTVIFEGNILRDDDVEKNGVVVFEKGEFYIVFGNMEAHGIADIVYSCYVIGNIHDNPELIRG